MLFCTNFACFYNSVTIFISEFFTLNVYVRERGNWHRNNIAYSKINASNIHLIKI